MQAFSNYTTPWSLGQPHSVSKGWPRVSCICVTKQWCGCHSDFALTFLTLWQYQQRKLCYCETCFWLIHFGSQMTSVYDSIHPNWQSNSKVKNPHCLNSPRLHQPTSLFLSTLVGQRKQHFYGCWFILTFREIKTLGFKLPCQRLWTAASFRWFHFN